MNKILSFTLAILLLTVATGYALDATVSGTEITVTYTEPGSNKTGTPLTDLDYTTIYVSPEGGTDFTAQVNATSPTGGGNIVEKIIVPVLVDEEVNVRVWATATDTSGNKSIDSNVATKRIDRLAPAAPQ